MTQLQTTSRPRRPRPKAVTLTDAAAERVREILDNADNAHIGLRIGVKNGGCAGQEYTFAYADEIGPMPSQSVKDSRTDPMAGTQTSHSTSAVGIAIISATTTRSTGRRTTGPA